MTSRERVLAALRHEETDRPPIDFGGMRSTGIMAMTYNRLLAHLGVAEETVGPGHGQILDNLKSLLLVAPIVFHYIRYFLDLP